MSVIDVLTGKINREAKKEREQTQKELKDALAEVRAAIDAKKTREEADSRKTAKGAC